MTPWKDHDTRELVNQLRDVAKTYADADQLRAQIAAIVLPAVKRLQGEVGRVEDETLAILEGVVEWHGDLIDKLKAVAEDQDMGIELQTVAGNITKYEPNTPERSALGAGVAVGLHLVAKLPFTITYPAEGKPEAQKI
jgi:hypothetical protein